MADHALMTIANPTAALTDFTIMVNLANMHASWWSAVTTTDGTRGRVYKGDGTTRLACDWIEFDDTAETGLLRVKWDGSLASSGTQQLWIEPPLTGNDAVAADNAYGSDNAYDSSWVMYAPADEGTGTAAGDRTANGLNGTLTNGPTWGTGKLGGDIQFDGTDDRVAFGTSDSFNIATYTVMSWFKTAEVSAAKEITHRGPGWRTSTWRIGLDATGELFGEARDSAGAGTLAYDMTSAGTYDDGNWHHVAQTSDCSGETKYGELFADGSSVDTDTHATNVATTSGGQVTFGAYNEGASYYFLWPDELDELQIHSAARSSAWIAYEYTQTNNNATFLGTVSWVAAATTVIPVVMNHYRRMRN